MSANSLISASVFENASLLAGRIDIKQRLQLAIAKARLHKRPLALMFVDLDRFHTINSTLGTEVGRQLVNTIQQRLTHALNGDHFLIHIGADEFVILSEAADNSSQLRQLANRLLHAIRKPIFLADKELVATASIGVSIYPNKAENEQTLLQQAVTATRNAKKIGGDGVKFFSRSDPASASLRELNIEVELRYALARKDLTVHYQPKMDLATGHITALEALVRWQHDELGWIPPSEFIPIAEKAGLISGIGEMVLETACRHGAKWIADGVPNTKIAVNY